MNPVSFLQAFISQSIKVAEQHCCNGATGMPPYIEQVGLAVSACLEEDARHRLGYDDVINANQYADMIIDIKNLIGGRFSRTSAAAGVIRVVSTACPSGRVG